MGPGATLRSRAHRLQSGRRSTKKAAIASCMSAEHSREAHASFSTRIACSMVRFRVTDAMALFFSESTFAHVHVATACIRGSCAGSAPTPVLRSMGSVPLRSMLGQFLCQDSRKAPSLRKVLLEKGHRSHGSVEGWLRVNRAVLIGCQVSAHAHAPRRLTIRQALGDAPTQPQFLETLPRRGYRFLAAVRTSPVAAPPVPEPPAPGTLVGRAPSGSCAGTCSWPYGGSDSSS